MELKRFLNNLFDRESETSLSRREALAGLGLVGVLLAAPKLIAATPAEAKALEKPAEPGSSQSQANADETQLAEVDPAELNAAGDATDLSARRYWRRRRYYWRRRHYWRRRYWRPRYWRRRRWWRRRWRRRYWY